MKSLFVVAASVVLILPTRVQSQEMNRDQQARFLRIELESYYKAYANACGSLRDLEQQVAVSTGGADRADELAKQREKLEAHLTDLRARANASQQSLIELTKSDEHPGFDQGPKKFFLGNQLEKTGRDLDVGIDGTGYFRAFDLATEQVVYTRIGSFDIDKDGQLILKVASRKLYVRPGIAVPEDAINLVFTDDGSVLVRLASKVELQKIGQMELVSFAAPEYLLGIDEGLFIQTLHSGEPKTGKPDQGNFGNVRQGVLEVSPSQRLRNLIVELQMVLDQQ